MGIKSGMILAVALSSLGGSAWGQTPVVTNVVNTGLLDKNFAPGSLVYIYGTFPQGAGRDFSITVGGQTGEVNVADNTAFITAVIPTTAPTGAQTLTVHYLGSSSNAFPIVVSPYAPELAFMAVAISNPPVFGPNTPFFHGATGQPVTLGSPAQPGEGLVTYTSGLGNTNPPTTGFPPNTFTTLAATPTMSVSSLAANVVRSGSGGPADEVDFIVPNAPIGIDPVVLTIGGINSNTALLPVQNQTTTFFTGLSPIGTSSVYYLQFPNATPFGYFNFVSGDILYHYDLGFEAVVLSNAVSNGVYLFDFTSGHWFYTSPALFPYLYDFTLNSWLYYFPATGSAGHYTSNPRYFSNLGTGKIITM